MTKEQKQLSTQEALLAEGLLLRARNMAEQINSGNRQMTNPENLIITAGGKVLNRIDDPEVSNLVANLLVEAIANSNVAFTMASSLKKENEELKGDLQAALEEEEENGPNPHEESVTEGE